MEQPRRDPGNHNAAGDVLHHHGAGADNGVLADAESLEDGRPNPTIDPRPTATLPASFAPVATWTSSPRRQSCSTTAAVFPITLSPSTARVLTTLPARI